jgi:UDP-sugar transporter A1/2/3
MLFGYLTMYLSDGTEIKTKGFLFGYTDLVWVAITVQSAGGILVALVIKYSDNIMKGFATSLAIIIACIVSMVLFDFQLTILFALGTSIVIFSIFIYSKPEFIVYVPIFNIIFRDKSVLL